MGTSRGLIWLAGAGLALLPLWQAVAQPRASSDAEIRALLGTQFDKPKPQPAMPSPETLAVPLLDVDTWCGRIADRRGVAACVRQEQADYDYVRLAWARLSDHGKRRCLGMLAAVAERNATYAILSGCVTGQSALERNERDLAAPPRFKP